MASTSKAERLRARRRVRVRKKITGTAERPRLTVFRSNRFIYAQLIDDVAGVTMASASSRESDGQAGDASATAAAAGKVGALLAERAKAAAISSAVFDRNGYRYHGRVAALADGAREGGLQI